MLHTQIYLCAHITKNLVLSYLESSSIHSYNVMQDVEEGWSPRLYNDTDRDNSPCSRETMKKLM